MIALLVLVAALAAVAPASHASGPSPSACYLQSTASADCFNGRWDVHKSQLTASAQCCIDFTKSTASGVAAAVAANGAWSQLDSSLHSTTGNGCRGYFTATFTFAGGGALAGCTAGDWRMVGYYHFNTPQKTSSGTFADEAMVINLQNGATDHAVSWTLDFLGSRTDPTVFLRYFGFVSAEKQPTVTAAKARILAPWSVFASGALQAPHTTFTLAGSGKAIVDAAAHHVGRLGDLEWAGTRGTASVRLVEHSRVGADHHISLTFSSKVTVLVDDLLGEELHVGLVVARSDVHGCPEGMKAELEVTSLTGIPLALIDWGSAGCGLTDLIWHAHPPDHLTFKITDPRAGSPA